MVEHECLVEHPKKWQTFFGDRKTFVFSSRNDLPIVSGADVTFLEGPVTDHIETLRAAAGTGDIHLVGGGGLAVQFAKAGHLDAIYLAIAPVTLGSGAPLFPAYFDSSHLRLTDVHQTGQFIQAEYEVVK